MAQILDARVSIFYPVFNHPHLFLFTLLESLCFVRSDQYCSQAGCEPNAFAAAAPAAAAAAAASLRLLRSVFLPLSVVTSCVSIAYTIHIQFGDIHQERVSDFGGTAFYLWIPD